MGIRQVLGNTRTVGRVGGPDPSCRDRLVSTLRTDLNKQILSKLNGSVFFLIVTEHTCKTARVERRSQGPSSFAKVGET